MLSFFFGPAIICFTIILTTVLLKVYRECTTHPSEARDIFAVTSCFLTSLGIGIKLANYLFG